MTLKPDSQTDSSRRRSTRLSVPVSNITSNIINSTAPYTRKRDLNTLQSNSNEPEIGPLASKKPRITPKSKASQSTSKATSNQPNSATQATKSPYFKNALSDGTRGETSKAIAQDKGKAKAEESSESEKDQPLSERAQPLDHRRPPRASRGNGVRASIGKSRRVEADREEEYDKPSMGGSDTDAAIDTDEEVLRTVMKASKEADVAHRQGGSTSRAPNRSRKIIDIPARDVSKPHRPQRRSRTVVAKVYDSEDDQSVIEEPPEADIDSSIPSSDLSILDSDFDSDLGSDEPIARTPVAGRSRKSTTSTPRAKGRRARVNKSEVRLTWWQRNQTALERHHPELVNVWGDLTKKVEVVKPTKAIQPPGLSLTLLPFQLEGLFWMKAQEAGPWSGGLLSDEMGMGKTIQTISLIISDRVPGDGKQTLVIAPTVAIMQWRNEVEKFTKGLRVNVWHGGSRSTDKKQMSSFDIVLTSYAVLESSFRRQNSGYRKKGELYKEKSLLHDIKWHRVILDEAHNIKDRSCNTAKGAFQLQAKYKWCLSGTPLQNRVGELYSLIRFLGADPFGYYFCKRCDCKSLHWMFSNKRTCDECDHSPMQHVCFWNNEILKPVQKYGASIEGSHGHTAFNKLKVLLDRMMLRRTKLERADDLGLPPRAVQVRRDYFTEEEEELYSSLYSDVKRKFSTFADAGTMLNNYGNIFQLITRMRQMSNHPDLVLKSKVAQQAFNLGGAQADPDEAGAIHTCRICLDEAEDAIISRCRHIFCRECIRQYLETASEREPECPVCHLPISIDLSQDAIDDEASAKAKQGVLARLDPGKWRTSTKIEALVEELSKLNHEDHSIKSLVFSQFTVFLDLIERRLQLAGFKLARLQGNMTPEARDRTIKYFMNNNDVQVFLVSLKAGGVALNLTEASRVFIMDPWWNPAVELQAMDRIHRLGQHRPVIVTRLIIENSIESRIVELQKKKEAMTGAALGDDDQALGRLTPEDLSFLFTL